MTDSQSTTSTILPTSQFEQTLSRLVGLPNGAHTQPTVVQAMDFYGNVSTYLVQTVKWEDGESVFITCVQGEQATKMVLPPKVTAAIIRQRDALTTTVRRRHGRRLAAERRAAGTLPTFTPEQRAKALATRTAKAKARARRRAAR
jgi:hypothetical protein